MTCAGRASSELITAPAPVITPHANGPIISNGRSDGTFTALRSRSWTLMSV
jgi:hypothetical protein